MDVTVSKERHLPCVSGGYSNTNPNEYSNNRINMVGTYRPFLLKSLDGLDLTIKQRMARLIAGTIKLMHENGEHPGLPNIFNSSEGDQERSRMNLEFWVSLGMKVDDPLYMYFDIEGFSFISEYFVCFHKDTQNDKGVKHDDTMSLKTKVLITHELSQVKRIASLMIRYSLKIGDYLPISLMIYSRKCVGDYCKKYGKMRSLYTDNPFTEHTSQKLTVAILNAIHDTESVQNYSKLWDNENLLKELMESMESDSKSLQCKAKSASRLPSYSKDVSYLYMHLILRKAYFETNSPIFQSYWSAVVDNLHFIGGSIMSLDASMVMGYVAFCSLEVNGTFLSCGIVEKCLASSDSRKMFESSVKEHGMYTTLVQKAIDIAMEKGSQVYTASEKPRHLGNNRGGRSVPIIGQKQYVLPEDTPAGSEAETIFLDGVYQTLDNECALIEKNLLDHCNNFCEITKKWEETSISKRSSHFPSLAKNFLKGIEEIGGKGIGPSFALNFLQVASMFGFIPQRMMTWSTVAHPKSGGYKFIKDLYKDDRTMNPTKADQYFNASISVCQDLYGNGISPYLIENLLCELWRKRDPSKITQKRDCFFGYNYRESNENPWGAQNLYRMVRSSQSKVKLEMCSPRRLLNNSAKKKVVVMEIGIDGFTNKSLINWEHNDNELGVSRNAKFHLNEKLSVLLDNWKVASPLIL